MSPPIPRPIGYIGSTNVPLTTTAQSLPLPPDGSTVFRATIQPQGVHLRHRPSAAPDPTPSAGFVLLNGVLMDINDSTRFYALRVVSESGTGTLEVAWYGPQA